MNDILGSGQYADWIEQLKLEQQRLRQRLQQTLAESNQQQLLGSLGTLLSDPAPQDWATPLLSAGWSRRDPLLGRLQTVEAGLCLHEQDMYGLCVDCEQDLTEQQLSADPASLRCPACEKRYQQRAADREFLVL